MVTAQRLCGDHETGSGDPRPVSYWDGFSERSGWLSVGRFGKAGDLASSGFFVQNTFFDCFVDDGLGCCDFFQNVFRVLCHGGARILDDILNPGLNRSVSQATPLVLAGAFQC